MVPSLTRAFGGPDLVASMGFLSKLFGGDSEAPPSESKAPNSRAVATIPPTKRVETGMPPTVERSAAIEEPSEAPTADVTGLKARNLKSPKLPPAAPALRERRALEPKVARVAKSEESTRRNVPTLSAEQIAKAKAQKGNRSAGRARPARTKSPGFYSVSHTDPPEPLVRSPREPADQAPPVPLEPVPNPASNLGGVLQEQKEETNPGLGNTRSRHEPSQAVALPAADVELLAEFGVELSLGVASSAWLPKVEAAANTVYGVARCHNRDEWLKSVRSLRDEVKSRAPLTVERRDRLLARVIAVGELVPLPFDVVEQAAIREDLILEQVVGRVAGAEPSVVLTVKAKSLTSLQEWANTDHESLTQQFGPTPPDWLPQALDEIRAYCEQRQDRGPSVALLGRVRAIRRQLNGLEAAAAAFQRATDGDDVSQRRIARKERQEQSVATLDILAEFGEQDILRDIEHCSVQTKIDRLGEWLTPLNSQR